MSLISSFVQLIGEWNSRYGDPVLESNLPNCRPQRFLNPGSGMVNGIGPVHARKLVNKFG